MEHDEEQTGEEVIANQRRPGSSFTRVLVNKPYNIALQLLHRSSLESGSNSDSSTRLCYS